MPVQWNWQYIARSFVEIWQLGVHFVDDQDSSSSDRKFTKRCTWLESRLTHASQFHKFNCSTSFLCLVGHARVQCDVQDFDELKNVSCLMTMTRVLMDMAQEML